MWSSIQTSRRPQPVDPGRSPEWYQRAIDRLRFQSLSLPIQTARLSLRPWEARDAASLAHLRDDPEVAHRTPVGGPFSLITAEAWIAERPERQRVGRSVALAITMAGSGAVVGEIQLGVSDWTDRIGELAYAVEANARGQGFATEAIAALTHAACTDLGLRQVLAHVEPDNVPSRRALLAAGFSAGAIQPGARVLRGRTVDLERFFYAS